MNFNMENNKECIDWEELHKKVDADLQNDIDNEIQSAKDIDFIFGKENGITNLKNSNTIFSTGIIPKNIHINPFNMWEKAPFKETVEVKDDTEESENSDYDFQDQGGFINSQEDIERLAWNNKKEKPMTAEEEKDIEEYLLNLEEPGMHPELKKKDIQCRHLEEDSEMYEDRKSVV